MSTSSSAATSYDAVARTRTGDMRSAEVPFRHFCNFVKKQLIQHALDVQCEQRHGNTASSSSSSSSSHNSNNTDNSTRVADDEVAVLDLASGRGGDLGKWMYMQSSSNNNNNNNSSSSKSNNNKKHKKDEHDDTTTRTGATSAVRATHYACYDISPTSIAEAEHRYTALLTQQQQQQHESAHSSNSSAATAATPAMAATFAVADCFSSVFLSTTLPQSRLHGHFAVVSVQFALHYACHARDAVAALMRSVAAALRPGGVLIATTVHPRQLRARLRQACTSSSSSPSPSAQQDDGNSSKGEEDANAATATTTVVVQNALYNIRMSTDAACRLRASNNNDDDDDDDDAAWLPACTPYHFTLDGFVDCVEYVVPLHALDAAAQSAGLQRCGAASRCFVEWLPMYESTWRHHKNNRLSHDERDLVSLYTSLCYHKQ